MKLVWVKYDDQQEATGDSLNEVMDQMISLLLVRNSHFPKAWWYVTMREEIWYLWKKGGEVSVSRCIGVFVFFTIVMVS